MESNEEINYASSSLRRRYSGRNNSFKSSPILKSGLRFRSRKSSATGSAESSPIVTAYKPVTDPSDLRKLPLLHELAFMVAIEASRDVKESWDAVVKEYCDAESKTTEPDDSLGPHAQLLYNSTQGHLDRLAKIVEVVKEQRNRNFDSQFFIPLYNFYKHEKARFYEVLQAEARKQRWSTYDNLYNSCLLSFNGCNLFKEYIKIEALTSLELDGVFNGRTNCLPKCIFMVPNLERLSLCANNLRSLPADIGRLYKLRCLKLSNNRLKNDSIPYTLSFCTELVTLLVDANALDAIPGYVLQLKKLQVLHRHGNQNYFRSTFMWYGCESRERIRTASFSDVDVAANTLHCATQVQSLQFWAARSIISSKANYFLIDNISESAKDYISRVYKMFNICSACNTASLLHAQGYFVFTFHNPYLGNTCVPFQHWTCSKECALAVEIPARKQQIVMARQQQKAYDNHVRLYSRHTAMSDTILEHPPTPTNTLLCTTCHPERAPARRRRLCKIM